MKILCEFNYIYKNSFDDIIIPSSNDKIFIKNTFIIMGSIYLDNDIKPYKLQNNINNRLFRKYIIDGHIVTLDRSGNDT